MVLLVTGSPPKTANGADVAATVAKMSRDSSSDATCYEPTVVIETVGAERCDVWCVSCIVLERRPLVQGRNIMDSVPPNLCCPFQSKAPQARRRLTRV
jgi:hypothetical protein